MWYDERLDLNQTKTNPNLPLKSTLPLMCQWVSIQQTFTMSQETHVSAWHCSIQVPKSQRYTPPMCLLRHDQELWESAPVTQFESYFWSLSIIDLDFQGFSNFSKHINNLTFWFSVDPEHLHFWPASAWYTSSQIQTTLWVSLEY